MTCCLGKVFVYELSSTYFKSRCRASVSETPFSARSRSHECCITSRNSVFSPSCQVCRSSSSTGTHANVGLLSWVMITVPCFAISVVIKHILHIRRPQAARGSSRRAQQQRPLKRAGIVQHQSDHYTCLAISISFSSVGLSTSRETVVIAITPDTSAAPHWSGSAGSAGPSSCAGSRPPRS